MADLTQQMVDMLFSFGEPGFQEFETKRYCTDILKARGFTISAGYGALKDATIRIGHMGDHTVAELELLLDALTEVLTA